MTTNENHSQTEYGFANLPAETGQGGGTKYGIRAFDSLPSDLQNVALTSYVNALNKGWQIPEAESIAREAVQRTHLTADDLPPPRPATPEDFTDDADEPIQETPATMPKIAKALFWAAGLMAVAYFALQAFLGPATPLRAAIDARASIAKDLAAATAKADASDKEAKADAKARDLLKARYEAAYKREACLVNGSCK
jgi:hypothetical protein